MALMANRLRRGLQIFRTFSTSKLSSPSAREVYRNPQKLYQLWSLSSPLSKPQFVMGGVRGVSNWRPLYSPIDTEGSKGGRGDTILFEGCDYEHWLVTMEFSDPQPSREEKIDTFIKTLAKVVGSEEEAKKKIYSLSTTTYTGFQANISEETSEKLKGLPGVVWVLPDSYIDPVNKEYGGDKYINGVIIPDTRVYNNRPSGGGRYNDRPRNRMRSDSMPVERRGGMQGDGRDFRPPMEGRGPMQGGDRQDYRPSSMEGRGSIPTDRQEHRQDYRPPPVDGRGPMPVDRQDYRPPPMDGRGPVPVPGDRQDYRQPPMDVRSPMPGDRQDYRQPPVDGRSPMPGYGQDYRQPPVDWRGPMPGYGQDYRPPPVDWRAPTPGYGQDYRPPSVDARAPTPGYGQDYRPPSVDTRAPTPGYSQDYRQPPTDGRWSMPGNQQDFRPPPPPPPPPMDGRGPMPGDRQDYRAPMDARSTMPGYRQDYRPPMDGRGPSPGYRQDYGPPRDGRGMGPNDRSSMGGYEQPREPMQGGSESAQRRDAGQVDQQPFPWPMEGAR